jgi:ABC-type sugar transport system substrate-binding protein
MQSSKRIAAVLAVALSLSVGALSSTASAEPKPFSLCVVHNMADHPSIAAIVKGMNDEAPLFGAKITYFDPAFDPQKQLSMIEDCIARKSDVIAVNAVDPAAVVPALKKAAEAGIPVIMHNADTNEAGQAYTKTFIGVKSYDQGYAMGSRLAKDFGGKATILVLTGKPGQTDAVNRWAGAEAAFKDAHANIKVLASEPADWSRNKALTVSQDLITRYPKFDAILAEDDDMALGALQALKAAGVDNVKIYGVGAYKEACDAIKRHEMEATALQPSYLIGVYTVRAAYDVLHGRFLPRENLAPTGAIDANNLARFESQCW